jgi:hypothetical protein
MPGKNSYVYYKRFLKCLRRYLEKKVEEQRKEKYIDNPEILKKWIRYDGDEYAKGVDLTADGIYAAFKSVFDEFIEKAPSACMGADNWFDKFLFNADGLLCAGMWCGHERCENNDGGEPYYCRAGNVPGKCKAWKAWRWRWRSYPEKEECRKCRHYKPEEPYDRKDVSRTEKINRYKCYCRAKELPEGCPKQGRKSNENGD